MSGHIQRTFTATTGVTLPPCTVRRTVFRTKTQGSKSLSAARPLRSRAVVARAQSTREDKLEEPLRVGQRRELLTLLLSGAAWSSLSQPSQAGNPLLLSADDEPDSPGDATWPDETSASTPKNEGDFLTSSAVLARNVASVVVIGLILLQNPKSQEAAQGLATSSMFGSMKQSANFLQVFTWVLIAVFIVSSAFLGTQVTTLG